MKAANLEIGNVISYDDKAWRVAARAVSTARGDGCVIMAQLFDGGREFFILGAVALIFDRFDADVWVHHPASSPYPYEWAYPPDQPKAGV